MNPEELLEKIEELNQTVFSVQERLDLLERGIDRTLGINENINISNIMPDTMYKSGDTLMEIGSDFLPDTTGIYDLGSSSLKWQDLHLNNDLVVGGDLTVVGGGDIAGNLIGVDNLVVTTINSNTASNINYGLSAIDGLTNIHQGTLTATGTAGTPFPSGWSVARKGGFATGAYTVTHTFGSTDYIVVASGAITTVTFAVVVDVSTNTFDVQTYDKDGTLTDTIVHFVVIET